MRQVSLGRKSLRREPLNTYSTTASERPARCRNGRNCFAFWVSWGENRGSGCGVWHAGDPLVCGDLPAP